jgi:hypothetical protein
MTYLPIHLFTDLLTYLANYLSHYSHLPSYKPIYLPTYIPTSFGLQSTYLPTPSTINHYATYLLII